MELCTQHEGFYFGKGIVSLGQAMYTITLNERLQKVHQSLDEKQEIPRGKLPQKDLLQIEVQNSLKRRKNGDIYESDFQKREEFSLL